VPSDSLAEAPLLERLAVCAGTGLFMGILLSLYVARVVGAKGPSVIEGFTLWGVVLRYVGVGLGMGVLAGLLLPLAQSALGAAVVGAICGAPLYAAFAYGTLATPEWLDSLTWFVPAGALGGGIGGFLLWRQGRRPIGGAGA